MNSFPILSIPMPDHAQPNRLRRLQQTRQRRPRCRRRLSTRKRPDREDGALFELGVVHRARRTSDIRATLGLRDASRVATSVNSSRACAVVLDGASSVAGGAIATCDVSSIPPTFVRLILSCVCCHNNFRVKRLNRALTTLTVFEPAEVILQQHREIMNADFLVGLHHPLFRALK